MQMRDAFPCFCENCSGGEWNEGGGCDGQTEPYKDPTGNETEPYYNAFISNAVKEMEYGRWKVQFLNITNLSEMRRDGHPSKYREEGTPTGHCSLSVSISCPALTNFKSYTTIIFLLKMLSNKTNGVA